MMVTAANPVPAYSPDHGWREWSCPRQQGNIMTNLNNGNRELTLNDLDIVSGGSKKGASGGLNAANGIDLTAFLAQLDRAIAKAKQI
jgi:hypothetical protein